ncbi:MAG: hypothetical protein ACKUBY_03455 [Candidatus Moraniibacteriota bacterium]|jgi:hypothetical protein
MYIGIGIIFFLIVTGIMLYLGFLYGKEDEKEKWHNILLKDTDRKKSLKWTATINIAYTSKKGEDPKISKAIGSTKSSTSDT